MKDGDLLLQQIKHRVLLEAQVATAKEFNIPLYYVQINQICYERDVEWFYSYYGEDK